VFTAVNRVRRCLFLPGGSSKQGRLPEGGGRSVGKIGGTPTCSWQVQVQVCFTSVDGQVQPLDVALGHSVLSKRCQ
jgi:hypothetical protein